MTSVVISHASKKSKITSMRNKKKEKQKKSTADSVTYPTADPEEGPPRKRGSSKGRSQPPPPDVSPIQTGAAVMGNQLIII